MPELDGLRGLAVMLTVLFHLSLYIPRVVTLEPEGWLGRSLHQTNALSVFGATGVQLFFVLSGFLLFRPYAEAIYARCNLPSTRRFFARRALRILPAYWTALFLIVLVRPDGMAPAGPLDVTLHAALLHDWSESTMESINPPFWTMAVESQFYLLLPALGLAVHRFALRGERKLLVALIALVGASTLLFVVVSAALERVSPEMATHRTALYPLAFLLTFGAGAALSFVHVGARRGAFPEPWSSRIPALAQVAGLVGIGLLIAQMIGNLAHPSSMNDHYALYWLWSVPLLSVGYGGLVIGTMLGFQRWKRLFSSRPLRFLGIISYSLYIWNIPLFRYAVLPLANHMRSDVLTVLVGLTGIVAVVIPASYFSYLLIERPAFSLRFRLR